MQNAKQFLEAAIELGTTVRVAKSLAIKKGFAESEIEEAIASLGLVAEKRRTFRTEFSSRIIDLLKGNPDATEKEAEKVFDDLVESYYPKGYKDAKASNTLKHRDYYLSVYYGFGKELLEAVN